MKEIDLKNKKIGIYLRFSKEPEETEEEKKLKKINKILNDRLSKSYRQNYFEKLDKQLG